MRPIISILMALLAVTLFSACSQEKPPAAEPVKPVVTEPQPVTEQTKQAAAEVRQEVKEAVAEVKQEATKQVEAIKVEATKQVEAIKVEATKQVEAAKVEVTKQVEAVKAEVATAIEQAKTTTIAAVDIARQGTTSALSGLTASEPAASPAVSAAAAKPPGLVVYDASMGKVSFDHTAHSGRLECSKCHPTDPPQKIAIVKEIAHTLCKGCHKISGGNAPTACAGCHKK